MDRDTAVSQATNVPAHGCRKLSMSSFQTAVSTGQNQRRTWGSHGMAALEGTREGLTEARHWTREKALKVKAGGGDGGRCTGLQPRLGLQNSKTGPCGGGGGASLVHGGQSAGKAQVAALHFQRDGTAGAGGRRAAKRPDLIYFF